ncbi:MAG TPA: lactonase family protein [Blastocatellia bacterium]|nr:lactonase family protein [Blastocatellia bacterium]
MLVYTGTYTTGKSEGIYIHRMDLSSGELKAVGTAKGVVNPSFLAIDPRRKYLYAVNEIGNFGGKSSGAVSAFSIDQKTGELKFLNQQPSLGAAPCYVIVDHAGRFVLAANYSGGNATVLPIRRDGSLGEPTFMVRHKGAGKDPERQKGPHAHCIVLDPANHYAFVADLGIDKVMIYPYDAKTGKLATERVTSAVLKPGAGPRHFTFHPDGRYAFVINELDSTLTAFAYDKSRGALRELQTISTLPGGFTGTNSCADVHVHPTGRFVYGSNRGHDSIVVFAFDEKTGKLAFVETVATQGQFPRNFAIDPTGKFLLAANQRSDNVVIFRIDPGTGRLSPTGRITEIPAPVCLKLIPAFS